MSNLGAVLLGWGLILIFVGMQFPSHPLQIAGTPAAEQRVAGLANGLPETTSNNWAGTLFCPNGVSAMFCAAGDLSVEGVLGCWVTPRVAQTILPGEPGGEEALSVWVGISGTQGNDLAQAGITEFPGDAPIAWWETLPSIAVSVPLNVAPGDEVCVQVQLAGVDGSGHQVWYFRMQDLTSGGEWDNGNSMQICGGGPLWPSCNPVDLSSAEWVVESPEVDGAIVTLPAFSAVSFTDLRVDSYGAWAVPTEEGFSGDLAILNLESGVAPTDPAFMTWTQPTFLPGGGLMTEIEYLDFLAYSSGAGRSGPTGPAVQLLSESPSEGATPLPPFSLALGLRSNAIPCGGSCGPLPGSVQLNVSSASPAYGLSFSHGSASLPPGNESACLWWAASGSNPSRLAPGSLFLECASGNASPLSMPTVGPTTPPTSNDEQQWLVGLLGILAGLVYGEVKALRGVRSRQSRSVKYWGARYGAPHASSLPTALDGHWLRGGARRPAGHQDLSHARRASRRGAARARPRSP